MKKRGCPRSKRYYPPVAEVPPVNHFCVEHDKPCKGIVVLPPHVTKIKNGTLHHRCDSGCDLLSKDTVKKQVIKSRGGR